MALTSVAELQSLIETKINKAQRLPETETLAVADVVGRVLAVNVVSTINIPCADISAMDGYALPAEAFTDSEWEIIGESVAGLAFKGVVSENSCVRIMTGAVVPSDCKTVVVQENTVAAQKSITLTQDVASGANIRFAGEEVACGDTVLTTGRILRASDVMLMAALGLDKVTVYRKIKVAILSTGNELNEPGTVISCPDQIYDSNRHALMARLQGLPVEIIDLGRAKDDLEGVMSTLVQASKMADVVITSGGVSVGDYDFMREAVVRLGAILHYKVALKPGKPFVFGCMFKTWYFGLPGNPVSGFVGFDVFLKSALWLLCGAQNVPQPLQFQATLSEPVKKSSGRMDMQRAIICQQADGSWLAKPAGAQDSHRIWGVSRANAYLILASETGSLSAGATVTVQPFKDAFL